MATPPTAHRHHTLPPSVLQPSSHHHTVQQPLPLTPSGPVHRSPSIILQHMLTLPNPANQCTSYTLRNRIRHYKNFEEDKKKEKSGAVTVGCVGRGGGKTTVRIPARMSALSIIAHSRLPPTHDTTAAHP